MKNIFNFKDETEFVGEVDDEEEIRLNGMAEVFLYMLLFFISIIGIMFVLASLFYGKSTTKCCKIKKLCK